MPLRLLLPCVTSGVSGGSGVSRGFWWARGFWILVFPWLLGIPRAGTAEPGDEGWILMRVADDPDRRVLVFDRNEWECFLDGARKGEFDDAAGNATS